MSQKQDPKESTGPLAKKRAGWHWPLVLGPRRVWRFFRSKQTPRGPKLMFLVALAYVILPTDLITDLAPVIGWLDDLGMVTLALAWLERSLSQSEAQMIESAPASPDPFDPK